MLRKLLLSSVFLFVSLTMRAQSFGVVQFSGVLNSADTSHKPISFATIYDLHTGNITISNYEGFFSIVALEGDSILFSSLGFKDKLFVVPMNIKEGKYSATLLLEPTFLMLKEQVVYPWGSRDRFPDAFVHTRIPDDDLERAKRNLNPEVIRSMIINAPADPVISSRMILNNYVSSLYYYGQPRPINLLSPLSWSQFISDIKNGRYKNPDK